MSTGWRRLLRGAVVCVVVLLFAATLWLMFSALTRVRTVSVAVVVALLLAALLDDPSGSSLDCDCRDGWRR